MKLQHPEVRIEPTNKCNATCIMCPRDEHHREQGTMTQAVYEPIIDEIVELGATQVVLTGFGEPMLDRGLEKKIAYAKNQGLRTYVISNGSAITEKRAYLLLQTGLDELRVSFYGMNTESYNAVMKGLRYDHTIKNLLQFLTIRDHLDIKTKVQLSYLILPENEDDVNDFLGFWEPKVDAVEIWKPHNFGDGRNYRVRFGEKTSCGRPENGPLQIQWNGEVVPCCFDFDNKIILGNINDSSIPDILNGERYSLLRQAHRDGEYWRFPYCDQCDQLLPHEDALVYTNRHKLPAAEAVKLSNTDLYNLADGKEMDPYQLTDRYK